MSRTSGLAIVWTLLILVLCWTPPRNLPIPETSPGILRRFHADKFVHCGMFLAFAFLWRRGTGPASAPIIAISGIALALITEVVQATPIVGRDADIWDAAADCLGVGLGLLAAGVLPCRLARRSTVAQVP